MSDIERRPGERRTNPLAAIQLSGGLVSAASQLAVMPQDLTQVDLRKLDLAGAMIAKPQLLFVDEVMAGLSHSEVDEILAVLMV